MSDKDLDMMIDWWLSLEGNESYEMTGFGRTDWFCDIFWEHEGQKGRDRIRKRNTGYELEELRR